jgi:invasion protein IalB
MVDLAWQRWNRAGLHSPQERPVVRHAHVNFLPQLKSMSGGCFSTAGNGGFFGRGGRSSLRSLSPFTVCHSPFTDHRIQRIEARLDGARGVGGQTIGEGILMPFLKKRLAVGLTGILLLAGGQAYAQARKPAQPAPAPAQAAPAPAAPAAPADAAPAGQQQTQGPVKVDLSPTQNDWTKVCGKDPSAGKEVCYTTRDFGSQPDQPPVLALAVYDVKGDDTRIVRFLMPVGLMLRPGFRFTIDKGAATDGGFEICFPNGCFAEARVKGPTIDQLKKGTILNVSVRNQVNNEVTFTVPLAGFGKSFDGPAVDPKVLEEQQKKLQEELQKRAEDERKRLEAAQPAPAPGAAAPAAKAPAPAGK